MNEKYYRILMIVKQCIYVLGALCTEGIILMFMIAGAIAAALATLFVIIIPYGFIANSIDAIPDFNIYLSYFPTLVRIICYPLIPFWFYVILIFSSTERIERGDDGYGGILRENTVEEIIHDLFFARRKAFFNIENYKENSLHYAQVKKLIEIIKG